MRKYVKLNCEHANGSTFIDVDTIVAIQPTPTGSEVHIETRNQMAAPFLVKDNPESIWIEVAKLQGLLPST